MPSRLYSGIDMLNYAVDNQLSDNSFPNPVVTSITSPGQARLTLLSSGDNTGANAKNEINGYYQISGDFDFSVFPAIPAGARITKVSYRVGGTIIAVADADAIGAFTSDTSVKVGISLSLEPTLFPAVVMSNIFIGGEDTNSSAAGAPSSVSVNANDNFTNVEEFDFSGSPITRAQLQAQFGTLFIFLGNVIDGTPVLSAIPQTSGDSSVSLTIELNNFELLVEYEDPSITLIPNGTTVEHGDRIRIVSPDIDISGASIAIVTDKIIIVEPDSQEPDEIVFTVPYKPDDKCLECVADCPDCSDDCFAACDDGLDSDECIECIEACFECLIQCIGSRGLAERCLGALDDEGETTPINIVITIPGTEFDGTTPVGGLVVLVADASGIYTIVLNKTNDTVYDSDRDGTTRDVKIPNPFGVSGFIKG